MSSATIKIKISPAVAIFVSPAVASDEKLRGLGAADVMTSLDQVMLCFCLMKDKDNVVKDAASSVFSLLTEASLLAFLEQLEIHPAILDAIAQFHFSSPAVVSALLKCQSIEPKTAAFLEKTAAAKVDPLGKTAADPEEELSSEEASKDDEEYLSKYKMVQLMGISEKIKMALTGDKEWRNILIKDSNKLVSSGVIKNPRITDGEILTIIKVGAQNDEIIRLICDNKEWIKNYAIRKALIENPKTPLNNSLRYLATLGEKDIAGYAKSKNISSVIATQARRILLAKRKD